MTLQEIRKSMQQADLTYHKQNLAQLVLACKSGLDAQHKLVYGKGNNSSDSLTDRF